MTQAVMLDRKFEIVREDLHRRFDSNCPTDVVDRILDETIAALKAEAKVESFLPVLAEREAEERIRQYCAKAGSTVKPRKEILFADQHGTGRCQIATALTHHLAGDSVFVRSVGLTPEKAINPHVLHILRDRGIATENLELRVITPRVSHRADVVVLMGIDEAPNVPGNRYVNWEVANLDATSEAQAAFVVDEIEARVRELLDEMNILSAV